MALTLIKEDGTGKSDANSYVAVADGDAFHDGHLYASAWTAADADTKAKALVMSSRVIDGLFQFHGVKAVDGQALQWPRSECRDPDGTENLDEDTVPKAVHDATCELARHLLVEDRTDDPDGTGLKYVGIEGSLKFVFDHLNRQPVLTTLLRSMLGKYGDYLGGRSGSVRLVRV